MADHGFDLNAIQKQLGSHSIYAPSASAMWLNCLGSLIANLLAEDDVGYEAAEGTVAHGVGERWLTTGIRPTDLVGTVEDVDEGHEIFHVPIDDEMLDWVERYVNWCNALPGNHFVEKRVDFSRLTPIPNQGGTADHIACQDGLMIITDLKYGKGEQVFARKNTQAMLYALGSFYRWDWEYNFERIIIRICQPRLHHYDEWEVSREELLEFADYVKERAALAWQKDAPRTPGEKQCRWCRVKSNCLSYTTWMDQQIEGVFDDLDGGISDDDMLIFRERLATDNFTIATRDIHTMTLGEKVKLVKLRRNIENWFKSLEDDIERTLQSGKKVPGYKLVEGRSTRYFKGGMNAANVLEMLTGIPASEFLETDLLSPAKTEKVLKKHGIKGKELEDLMSREYLVGKPPGKPVMAPEHDKRPELSTAEDNSFDTLDDDWSYTGQLARHTASEFDDLDDDGL